VGKLENKILPKFFIQRVTNITFFSKIFCQIPLFDTRNYNQWGHSMISRQMLTFQSRSSLKKNEFCPLKSIFQNVNEKNRNLLMQHLNPESRESKGVLIFTTELEI
jgi:hypothetical protein